MNNEHTPEQNAIDQLATFRNEANNRFERELEDVRTTMAAMAACCEQSLSRLRDARWVPFDDASQLVKELTTALDAERARVAALTADTERLKADLQSTRSECQKTVNLMREEAARERQHIEARFMSELNAARANAQTAAAAEAKAREELVSVGARSQQLVEAQLRRLMEFKQELEHASVKEQLQPDAGSARADGGSARNETFTRPMAAPAGRVVAPAPAPARPPAPAPARAAVPVPPPPRAAAPAPVSAPAPAQKTLKIVPVDPTRNQRAPEFAAIEAVLAGSPPVGEAWQKRGA
jgi:hypothetical protein